MHLGRVDPEAEGDEQVERALGLFLAEEAKLAGADQVERQADGHCLAVRQAMVRHRLKLVRGPMTQVERTGAAQLEGVAVAGDMTGVQFGGTTDGATDGGEVAGGEQRGLLLEVGEEDRILEQRDLHGFDESVAEAAGVERSEQREVVDHGGGDGEGAGEVLLPEGIDAVLHAHAGVALAEGSGGHADKTDAAVGGGGREADGVEEGASADGEHVRVAADLVGLDRGEGGLRQAGVDDRDDLGAGEEVGEDTVARSERTFGEEDAMAVSYREFEVKGVVHSPGGGLIRRG